MLGIDPVATGAQPGKPDSAPSGNPASGVPKAGPGRGAVKDTYNLRADGIRQLLRPLAQVQDMELAAWAAEQGYARYLAASLKGTAEIDWDAPTAREALIRLNSDGLRAAVNTTRTAAALRCDASFSAIAEASGCGSVRVFNRLFAVVYFPCGRNVLVVFGEMDPACEVTPTEGGERASVGQK